MINPIEQAKQLTLPWMMSIHAFDALETWPCRVVSVENGKQYIETCKPDQAQFRSLYGHLKTGGLDWIDDFPTEEAAKQCANRIRAAYPHLAEGAP